MTQPLKHIACGFSFILRAVYKGRPADGKGWLNFGRYRTRGGGGGGGVVCENSEARKLLKKNSNFFRDH